MKRVLCLALCLVLLCVPVFAAQDSSPEALLRDFMTRHGLDETNFALSYYNVTTGEQYAYNADAFLPAGGVWMLPLHMYYYEQEALGAFDPPEENPDFVYTIDGLTLEDCRYRSILQGDEEVAQKMCGALGSFEQYQLLINESFGHYAESSLPRSFLTDRCYSAGFLMNCLREAFAPSDTFGAMLQNYRLAQTGDGFAAYEHPYSVFHIRGEANGMLCDVGQVAAPQTYLLVCFVSEEAGGDALLAEVNTLICDCVLQSVNGAEASGDTASTPSRADNEPNLQINGTNIHERSELLLWVCIALGAAAVLALAIGGAVLLVRRRKRNRYDDL